MLHKVRASHGDILKGLPELTALLPPTERKKQTLLDMAGRGEPKPHRKTPLGKSFLNYTYKSSKLYDPKFAKKIKETRPDWLTPQIVLNKRLLLDMAARGEPKPPTTTRLGQVFRTYTQKSSKVYDPKFTKRIRELRPDWLATLDESTNNKMQLLLDIAAKGGAKPHLKTQLGRFLYSRTLKSSIHFNLEFANKIKKLAANWLTPSNPERSSRIKQRLLEMAAKGEPKPSGKTSLYKALYRYTQKSSNSYDPEFAKKIRRIAPLWFKNPADHKKKQLLDIARKGKRRPDIKSPLGIALQHYTYKKSKSYDHAFTKSIKKLAPHWFRRFRKCSTR